MATTTTGFRFDPCYRVEATYDKGKTWTEVHRGRNRDEAVRIANFWDERVDVRFHEADRSIDARWDALEHYIRTGKNV